MVLYLPYNITYIAFFKVCDTINYIGYFGHMCLSSHCLFILGPFSSSNSIVCNVQTLGIRHSSVGQAHINTTQQYCTVLRTSVCGTPNLEMHNNNCSPVYRVQYYIK